MKYQIVSALQQDGIAILPEFVTGDQLRGMQQSFENQLCCMRWNNFDGFEKTEPYRHMVQDVLTLDQGFVDVALHPLVKDVLRSYVGEAFQLVEAKGWKSIPTDRDFHGWHADAWYDEIAVDCIPWEVKLGLYLTDVRSGAFNYMKGSHRQQTPWTINSTGFQNVKSSGIVEVMGPAGTAFLFDTSGVHCQAYPIREPRRAVFFNYHDPSFPLQQEDLDYYRYHPLLLNAAFLGEVTEEDRRILGFGDKAHYIHAFKRAPKHAALQAVVRRCFDTKLQVDQFGQRVRGRLARYVKPGGTR